ncbi:MAG: YebC/PmpR family DNA-binding transcriptional regulator [Gammaproteobacteria bacterium]
MAGHSKWANIKHQKAKQDAKKGKVFTKLIREITVAAKQSGEPNANPRLRAAMDKALSFNMTRDTIDKAIKRGVGGLEDQDLEEIRYEGYGPSGVAIIVDCMTNNRKRTVSEVRHLFTKFGGNLGTDGSVAYLFSQAGLIICPNTANENIIMEMALEFEAEDVNQADSANGGQFEIKTTASQFNPLKQALETAKQPIEHAELTWLASTQVPISQGDTAEKLMKLIDGLEDLDDVQAVYSNAEFDESCFT